MKLYIDTKEPNHVKAKFQSMAIDYPDLEVEVKSLKTGDFLTDYFVIERKELDDFISSFTHIGKRKTKEDYERMKQQTERMLKMKQPIKVFLVIGENFKEAYSDVHEHSYNAQLMKLAALGIQVWKVSKYDDWPDMIYRLCRMASKYGVAGNQTVLV